MKSHFVRLCTLIIYAGQLDEVTNFAFFSIYVPPGRIIFLKSACLFFLFFISKAGCFSAEKSVPIQNPQKPLPHPKDFTF